MILSREIRIRQERLKDLRTVMGLFEYYKSTGDLIALDRANLNARYLENLEIRKLFNVLINSQQATASVREIAEQDVSAWLDREVASLTA